MIKVFRHRRYATLFAAQVIALLGTGLLTIALGLLAFQIAGGKAGIVMATALSIKMVAYVVVAPVASAFTWRVPRKVLLVSSDLIRASVAISLPFVSSAEQIYLLIFILQTASGIFTPAFQALIPQVLSNEADYTQALSLSRLAYDLESLLSPMIAAALLTIMSYQQLFSGTALGFLGSTSLVLATKLPQPTIAAMPGWQHRLIAGAKVFVAQPELRGLAGLNMVVACAVAFVIVNSVVVVRHHFARTQSEVALLLAAYGVGSMLAALVLPQALKSRTERAVMLCGAAILVCAMLLTGSLCFWPATLIAWLSTILLWFALGTGTSLVLTPSARLLRRASEDANRPAVFAAQFSFSHACYLITYPLAGTLGATLGLGTTSIFLAVLAAIAAIAARQLWPQVSIQGLQKIVASQ